MIKIKRLQERAAHWKVHCYSGMLASSLKITLFICLQKLGNEKEHLVWWFASCVSLFLRVESLQHHPGCNHHAVIRCASATVWVASHGGALNGIAGLIHTPAVASSVPALHGLVVALLVTLGLVGTNLADSRFRLQLAFGLDQRG